MKILLNDIDNEQTLEEQAMTDISGGYTPNPEGPYPPGPFPFPWPYQNGLQRVERVRPQLAKLTLAKLKLKRRVRLGSRRRR